MTAEGRARRTTQADALCQQAWTSVGGPDAGAALVAVGGYGRGELAPASDLDVVLVHDEAVLVDPGALATELWYPLWDSGQKVDHAVRSLGQARAAADADVRVALGLLDARHVAGDPAITLRLRSDLLTHWRRDARTRLPELRDLTRQRGRRVGELAHLAVPDLKESLGGLRDATTLKALVATWLVDVPHAELERCRQRLLDVRDALHAVTGRAGDRIPHELWGEIADELGLSDARQAERSVRGEGRQLAHLSRLTWRRVDALLRRPAATAPRRPRLDRVAPGVAVSDEEVVLDADARPESDPGLLFRAATEAATRDLVLAPTTSARLARVAPPLPDPWPAAVRDQFVRLLAAGEGLRDVWETLEATRAVDPWLPEWERIRLLPHASTVHQFTVDRHSIETVICASRLIRRVTRPDLLVVAALLHDIGKGGSIDHSIRGEPVATEVARRMGFADADVRMIGRLVRHHLVLSRASTTRDPDDPATADQVAAAVGDLSTLTLLEALTEADARATAPAAWTDWRAGLVRRLAANVRLRLGEAVGTPGPPVRGEVILSEAVRAAVERGEYVVTAAPAGTTTTVTVVAQDRVGLLADIAGALALRKHSVLAARVWTDEEGAVSQWDLDAESVDPALLAQTIEGVAEGRVDAAARLGRVAPARLEPVVAVHPDASADATVLEVRMDDRPGVVYLVAAALASLRVVVRSAHVSTVGPQAVDVFYLCEHGAGALSDLRAAAAAHAVRAALLATATLDRPTR